MFARSANGKPIVDIWSLAGAVVEIISVWLVVGKEVVSSFIWWLLVRAESELIAIILLDGTEPELEGI